MQPVVRIVRPAGKGGESLLPDNLNILKEAGFRLLPEEPLPEDHWPYTASSCIHRQEALTRALTERESEIILCARGGYGAGDLLPFLPWDHLKATPHKWLVGFSDITALHWGLYTLLGWPSVHAPMPASTLWARDPDLTDIKLLINILSSGKKSGGLSIRPLNARAKTAKVAGPLLGGCLSVICSLSGTRYFPHLPCPHLIFLEDTGENPGRLMRHWNQLRLNGLLDSATGVIFGRFTDHGSELSEETIRQELASRTDIPCWESPDFGHTSPNLPLVNGALAEIKPGQERMTWYIDGSRLSHFTAHSEADYAAQSYT